MPWASDTQETMPSHDNMSHAFEKLFGQISSADGPMFAENPVSELHGCLYSVSDVTVT